MLILLHPRAVAVPVAVTSPHSPVAAESYYVRNEPSYLTRLRGEYTQRAEISYTIDLEEV